MTSGTGVEQDASLSFPLLTLLARVVMRVSESFVCLN